jgi:hypothetical protein
MGVILQTIVDWSKLETWINSLPDTDKKQQYLHTLKRLKDE